MPWRYLILTADAGFGHRSAANAVAAALGALDPPAEAIDIVNLFDHDLVPAVVRDGQSDYDRVVREAPRLYEFAYTTSESAIPNLVFSSSVTALFYVPLRDTLARFRPDVVISTYPLYQHALVALQRVERRRVASVCVVTDLATVHRIWFESGIDAYVVPTPAVRQIALENDIEESRIHEFGIPVNPALAAPAALKPELRRRLGWAPDRFTLLAVGSKRVQRLPEMLRGLNHSGLPIQLVISAGKDDGLHEQLKRIEWHVPAHIYPFVDQMPAFMHASDCVLAKAGGLIVTETLAAGLPLILTELIPGQETGNADYVIDHAAGALCDSPLDVLETVFSWLDRDGAMLKVISANARLAGKPDAAANAAGLAAALAEKMRTRAELEAPRDQLEIGRLRALLKQYGLVGDG